MTDALTLAIATALVVGTSWLLVIGRLVRRRKHNIEAAIHDMATGLEEQRDALLALDGTFRDMDATLERGIETLERRGGGSSGGEESQPLPVVRERPSPSDEVGAIPELRQRLVQKLREIDSVFRTPNVVGVKLGFEAGTYSTRFARANDSHAWLVRLLWEASDVSHQAEFASVKRTLPRNLIILMKELEDEDLALFPDLGTTENDLDEWFHLLLATNRGRRPTRHHPVDMDDWRAAFGRAGFRKHSPLAVT